MQEKVERLLDKHMLNLGSSYCRTIQHTPVTNVYFLRCIKAFIVNNFVRRVVEEVGKARWQQLRGKSDAQLQMQCESASNISDK